MVFDALLWLRIQNGFYHLEQSSAHSIYHFCCVEAGDVLLRGFSFLLDVGYIEIYVHGV